MAAELLGVAGGVGHVPGPETYQLADDRLELSPLVGEVVERRGHRGRRRLSSYESVRLKLPQSIAEEVGGDAGQPGEQVGVAAPALEEKLADHQERPPIADGVEGLGDRTVLTVGTHVRRLFVLALVFQ
jgi:hypothetical protein